MFKQDNDPSREGDSTLNILARAHPLLAPLDDAALAAFVRRCTSRRCATYETVLTAGESNARLFLVLAGDVYALLDPTNPKHRMAIFPGECFGEMSLIDDMPVSATVVADCGAHLLVVDADAFWTSIRSEAGMARGLLRAMSARMRQRSELVMQSLRERYALEAVQRELQYAQEMQTSMLADGAMLLKDYHGLDAMAVMTPAKIVGGDFFDAFGVSPKEVFIAIGDVAGKGMPAALFMARSLTTLRLGVASGQPYDSLLTRFNNAMCEHNPHSTFVTVFAGFIDTADGTLMYFDAGHHAALVISPMGEVTALPRPPGMVAGVLSDSPFLPARYRLKKGEVLFAYTDGVTEAQNAQGEFFGEERLMASLADARRDSATAFIDSVRDAIAAFVGARTPADDITLLAVRIVEVALPLDYAV